jgi:zeta-carotene desaturase
MARKAIVIGAGWAGCSAAWSLSQAGWKVALFEKSSRLGGRASSFQHPKGWILDNGQHLFLGAYRRTLAMLESLGTAKDLSFQHALEVPFFLPQGRHEILEAGRGWGPWGLWKGIRSLSFLDPSNKAAFFRFGLKASLDLAWPHRLEGVTALDWLVRQGQPEALVQRFWEPLCLAALNASAASVQASALAKVLVKGFLRGAPRSCLGFSKKPLSVLLEPLPGLLARQGGEARFEDGAARLVLENGRVSSLESETGKSYSADAYVLALPHSLAASLLPAEWSVSLGLDALKHWPCSPILSVQVFSPKSILPQPFGTFLHQQGNAEAFHWAFDRNRLLGQGQDGEVLTSFVCSAAEGLVHFERAILLEKLWAQLESFFPGFRREEVLEAVVLKEMRATPLLKPGSSALRLSQATAVRNLALAGDWTDTGLPATIEGAVVSGERAAKVLK